MIGKPFNFKVFIGGISEISQACVILFTTMGNVFNAGLSNFLSIFLKISSVRAFILVLVQRPVKLAGELRSIIGLKI